MNRLNTRSIIEALGVAGVVGSLIFVGMELRQNSIATRSQASATISEQFAEPNLLLASNPELIRAFAEHGENPEEAPYEAQIAIRAMWRSVFHIWSNVYRQANDGTISPALFDTVTQEISLYSGNLLTQMDAVSRNTRSNSFHYAWENEKFLFPIDFQMFVDDQLSKNE